MDFSNYVSALSKDLRIDKLPEKERNQIIADIGEAILQRTLVTVYERLSPTDREEFEKIDHSLPNATMNFLRAHVADFDTLVSDVSRELIGELKS